VQLPKVVGIPDVLGAKPSGEIVFAIVWDSEGEWRDRSTAQTAKNICGLVTADDPISNMVNVLRFFVVRRASTR
jgi:hypothetical protein